MPSSENPLDFTVVIPTCHRNAMLALCLRALAPNLQTLPRPRYEVVVSDDGHQSTAKAMMQEEFPWARWVAGPRRGPAANRNHGARQGQGSWLVFTDDDCIPEPGWLAAYAEARANHPSLSVLEGRTTTGGRPIAIFEAAPVNETGGYLWSCNFAIVREVFEAIGGFDEGFASPHLEDTDLRLRLGDRNIPFLFVRMAVVVHPPRPITSIRRQLLNHESSFYLARKRGVPLRQVGFGLRSYFHARAKQCLRVRSPGELFRVVGRNLFEMAGLLALIPFWRFRYRKN